MLVAVVVVLTLPMLQLLVVWAVVAQVIQIQQLELKMAQQILVEVAAVYVTFPRQMVLVLLVGQVLSSFAISQQTLQVSLLLAEQPQLLALIQFALSQPLVVW
jgi:hypothetical protein